MIVESSIRHRAEILPKRARKVRKSFHESVVATMLRERASADAPMVLRRNGTSGASGLVDVRIHDGLLWEPHPDSGSALSASELAAFSIRDFSYSSHLDAQADHAARAGREWQQPGGRVVSSNLDTVARKVQEWADTELLVVDGVLHVRARSPLVDLIDVVFGFGGETAGRLMDAHFVPAWFAVGSDGSSMREALAEARIRDADPAAKVFRLLDIEIVDPTALAACAERSAVHSDVAPRIGTDVKLFSKDPRTHAGAPAGSKPGREAELSRLLSHVAKAAAASVDGSFVEACAAAKDVFRPLAGRPSPVGTVDPVPSDVATVPANVFYAKGTPRAGWDLSGRGQALCAVEVPLADPDVHVQVAGFDGTGIHHGPLGFLATNFQWGFSTVRTEQARSRIDHVHAGKLHDGAKRTGGHAQVKTASDDDFFRSSLRPFDRSESATDAERERLLREFARERLVDLDGRTGYRCPEPLYLVVPDAPSWQESVGIDISYARRISPGAFPPFAFRLERRAEAIAFMDGFRWVHPPEAALPRVNVLDASPLRFDTALWNLRAALWRIVLQADARVSLLPPDAAAAVGRIALHVETWASDTRLVESPDLVEAFVADARTFLSVIADPLLDDVGDDSWRETAARSLDEVLSAHPEVEVPDEDGIWRGMTL